MTVGADDPRSSGHPVGADSEFEIDGEIVHEVAVVDEGSETGVESVNVVDSESDVGPVVDTGADFGFEIKNRVSRVEREVI